MFLAELLVVLKFVSSHPSPCTKIPDFSWVHNYPQKRCPTSPAARYGHAVSFWAQTVQEKGWQVEPLERRATPQSCPLCFSLCQSPDTMSRCGKKLRSWHLVPSLHGKQKGKSGSSDRFYFLGRQNHCSVFSHEIKRHLLLGRKSMTNLDTILKRRDITLLTKVQIVKARVFSSNYVWM